MVKNVDNLDPKFQLVTEICAASTGCAHRSCAGMDQFIDWYLLLRVSEDADNDGIKKHYFKLALQLHPDKNSHPNAEIAFKLISQAYTCLSDELKRRVFDLDRLKNSCLICDNNLNKSDNFSSHYVASKIKGFRLDKSNSSRFWKGWREIRERFKMEASVIEDCLKSNATVPKKEYPIFRPSNYAIHKGYPRCEQGSRELPIFKPAEENHTFRTYPAMERVRSSKSWYSEKRNGWSEAGRRMQETPVFEVKQFDLSRLNRSQSTASVHPLWKAT